MILIERAFQLLPLRGFLCIVRTCQRMNKGKEIANVRDARRTGPIDDLRNLRVVFAWSVAHEIVRRLSIAVAVLVFRVCRGGGCERLKIPPQCRGPLTTTPSVCENLRAIHRI